MDIVTITNQKGGVGKTSTTLNLAAALIRRGYKPLVVDLDPQQGNLSQTVGADKTQESMFEVLCGDANINEVIQTTKMFDIATATLDMQGIESKLNSMSGGAGREHRLAMALEDLPEGKYDIVLIDTPPALDVLTTNALVASNKVLVVVEADVNAMHGMKQLGEAVSVIRKFYNKDLGYSGILMTKFQSRTNNGRDMRVVAEAIGESIGTGVFKTAIRHGASIPDAMRNQMDAYSWDKESGPAVDYEAFADEFIQEMGLQPKTL